MKPNVQKTLTSYLLIFVGCVLNAVAFDAFFAPNSITYGGFTGLSQAINHLLGFPRVGTLIILLNVPLFLLGWRLLGGRLLISSLFAMLCGSLLIDGLDLLFDFPTTEPLLAAIYGGVLMGLSLGLVIQNNATTGGTDLLARLLKLRFRWLPMGKLLLMIDLFAIALGALAFRTLNSALYGIIALYISSLVMDWVLYGMDNAKMCYIISSHPREITDAIFEKLNRGITHLHGEGGYTGEDKRILMCAFKTRQIALLKETVKAIDPDAFLIVCDAHEVLGDGFRAYHKDSY